ncbi:MAG: hypothetical protein K0Q74_790 [Gammaproteobacteria bacterium]|jgi:hypothetical protein|nr:hypothetical protein [Gammaproteobacteria bacterium]
MSDTKKGVNEVQALKLNAAKGFHFLHKTFGGQHWGQVFLSFEKSFILGA